MEHYQIMPYLERLKEFGREDFCYDNSVKTHDEWFMRSEREDQRL